MPFKALVAHRFYRSSPTAKVDLTVAPDLWPLNGKTEDCARHLKRSWLKKGGKIYGRFTDDQGVNPLPAWLKNWSAGEFGFQKLTSQWMTHGENLLAQTECPLDAFVVFAHEELEADEFVWLFVCGHEPAFVLSPELALEDTVYLDVDKLIMAAKISVKEWQSGDSAKYLTFVRASGDRELSEWFESWLGFTDKLDTAKQTEQFLSVVDDYAKQLPEEKAFAAREKVVDYCLEQSKAGESVELDSLAAVIAEEGAPSFTDFAINHESRPPKELVPHAGQLRQYVRISGRNEELSMSFSSGCLGETVVYDADSDALVIKKLPASLKARLMKHLK